MTEFDAHSRLRGAVFRSTDLTGARLRNVTLKDVKIVDADIDGMQIHGIEIGPLIEQEIDRRWPEHAALRPTDPDDMRELWARLEERWATAVERARKLPEDALRERVDEEWSFIQTLRHLTFATEAWIVRGVLGEEKPFHATSLAWDGPWTDHLSEVCGLEPSLDPSLDDVLAVRAVRQAVVRELLTDITPERLEEPCPPNSDVGYPSGDELKGCIVRQCIWTIFSEEWWHHLYATRDLEQLERRA